MLPPRLLLPIAIGRRRRHAAKRTALRAVVFLGSGSPVSGVGGFA